jgi:hypothetical protein
MSVSARDISIANKKKQKNSLEKSQTPPCYYSVLTNVGIVQTVAHLHEEDEQPEHRQRLQEQIVPIEPCKVQRNLFSKVVSDIVQRLQTDKVLADLPSVLGRAVDFVPGQPSLGKLGLHLGIVQRENFQRLLLLTKSD